MHVNPFTMVNLCDTPCDKFNIQISECIYFLDKINKLIKMTGDVLSLVTLKIIMPFLAILVVRCQVQFSITLWKDWKD